MKIIWVGLLTIVGIVCISADECSLNPCKNGGAVSMYTCSCASGFDGDNCEINIDECGSNPCQNGGTCIDGDNMYRCDCPTDFNGHNCERDYYQVVRNYDCLLGMNLFAVSPSRSFEECKVWCKNNRTCGGFIVTAGMCYFKSQECKDNMQSVLNTTLYIKEDKYRYYNLSNRNCKEEAFHIMDGLGAEITVDDCKWWCSNNNTCKFIFISHSPLKRCEFKTDACRNITVNRLGSGEFHTKFECHYSLCPLRSCTALDHIVNSYGDDIDDCHIWCNNLPSCEGFHVRGNKCQMKFGGCRETIQPSQDTHLYLKGGCETTETTGTTTTTTMATP